MANHPKNLGTSSSNAESKLPKIFPSQQRLPKIDLISDSRDVNTEHNGENKSRFEDSLEGDLLHDHHHLPSTQNLSVPSAGNRIRRKSAPSMLEPIQEGLLGISNRRNSGPGFSVATSLDKKDRFQHLLETHASPLGPQHSRLSQRRRSDPIGLFQPDDKLKLFSFEARYPAPRRNSLVSATLDELSSQFELLDRRKRVVEESELAEADLPILPPILITDS
ncbi:uncharacterized protein [Apostichopus japonicus]|uniref:uncharacterized protein n=1 Tax=Stichopus japonicus TaxID=307972 RepID=UPI003AB5FE24